jgi:type VI secretion system protein ImpA
MSTIDVDALLQEISPEAPCGENLEYDQIFLDMALAAEGKPEQQMGNEVIAAEPPNWKEVKEKAIELAGRTRDLRVGVYLARALVRTEGLPGLLDALQLLQGYVGRYWEPVHPQLDPDDGSDPTFRVNTLVALQGANTLLNAIRDATLIHAGVAGDLSFRNVLVARGNLDPHAEEDPPSQALINGAFAECDLEELMTVAKACAESQAISSALENELTERVGVVNAADMSALPQFLSELQDFLDEQLAARGIGDGPKSAEDGDQPTDKAVESGGIHTRDDVLRTLDRICRYYQAHEPSSPVPMLMNRARRLVHASFIDAVKDLAPEGLSQVENLRGQTSEADQTASESEESE